jgi:hypothetical protein
MLARAAVASSDSPEARTRAAGLLVSAREGYREAKASDDLKTVAAWAKLHRVR